MNAEIITHAIERPPASSNSPLIGMIHVLLEGKIKVWMRVLRSKQGHIYARFPDTKVRDAWMPVLEYVERDLAREISTQLKDELDGIFK